MKGMISGIKRMEIHDGDGLRTTVFFKGCPLKCIWCHNPESISYNRQIAFFENKCVNCGVCHDEKNEIPANLCPTQAIMLFGQEYEVDELVYELMKDEVFYKNSGGGVTLSGGECLAQPDFATALSKKLYQNGISVYVDTCGYVSQEVLKRIIPYTDKFLYDIKAINNNVHKKCTTQENHIILENLEFLCENDCKIEIRYPLVKGYNEKEAQNIGLFLKDLIGITKVKVLQYHHFAGSRYKALNMENTLPVTETSYQDVQLAVNILKSYGLNAVNGIDES